MRPKEGKLVKGGQRGKISPTFDIDDDGFALTGLNELAVAVDEGVGAGVGAAVLRRCEVEAVDVTPLCCPDVHGPTARSRKLETLDFFFGPRSNTTEGDGVTEEVLGLLRIHRDVGRSRRQVWGGRVEVGKRGRKIWVEKRGERGAGGYLGGFWGRWELVDWAGGGRWFGRVGGVVEFRRGFSTQNGPPPESKGWGQGAMFEQMEEEVPDFLTNGCFGGGRRCEGMGGR